MEFSGYNNLLISIEGADRVGKSSLIGGLLDHYEFLFYREPGGTTSGEIIRSFLSDSSGDYLDDRFSPEELRLGHPGGRQLAEELIADRLSSTNVIDFVGQLLDPPASGRISVGRNDQPLSPTEQLYLFNIARGELLSQHLNEDLCNDQPILLDRFIHSTLAYQGYAAGIDLFDVEAISDQVLAGLRPSLTILLDLEDSELLKRNQIEAKPTAAAAEGMKANREAEAEVEAEAEAELERVSHGFRQLALADDSIVVIDAGQSRRAVLDQAIGLIDCWLGLDQH